MSRLEISKEGIVLQRTSYMQIPFGYLLLRCLSRAGELVVSIEMSAFYGMTN